ncbi:MAG: polysaccharide biosynthesis protein [Acidimicrobiia bacterium]|nr:polysaccharide biosynthesis protein [Acidimicrobiia bacterium]
MRATRWLHQFLRRFPTTCEAAADVVAWAAALVLAMLVRFDLTFAQWERWNVALAVVLAAGFQLGAGYLFGLYLGRWRTGSFDEVASLAKSAVVVSSSIVVLGLAVPSVRLVPSSVGLAAGGLALLAMAAARYVRRVYADRLLRPRSATRRVVVFGAGEGGAQALRAMLRNPDSPYLPVVLLDDDPAKRNLRILGVPVVGDRHDLDRVAREYQIDELVVAVPSADSAMIRELSERALDHDVAVRALPQVHELFDGKVGLSDIRPLTEADLLGRHEIDTDIDAIAGYLTGQRVLVTGAGGSIGSELCRQIHRFGPASLVLLDRDESALHATQLDLHGRALLDSRELVVADLRDRERIFEVFAEHRPEVVFHAAALKHLPLLEMYPTEAVKTNVWGTYHLLEAAAAFEVDRFVNVSTDKAADPSSVLGYTKRLAERLTAWAATETAGTYLSVRFGNVLGSRGSMLGAFERQVAAGGPITVTHPEVTRFFMTIEEASQLVIQAGAVGRDGEALVLDMGEPVRILDVARRLVAEAERPVDIVFTGLRPGEKLHEVLMGRSEVDERPAHPLISHAPVPAIAPVDLEVLTQIPEREALIAELARLGRERPAGVDAAQ